MRGVCFESIQYNHNPSAPDKARIHLDKAMRRRGSQRKRSHLPPWYHREFRLRVHPRSIPPAHRSRPPALTQTRALPRAFVEGSRNALDKLGERLKQFQPAEDAKATSGLVVLPRLRPQGLLRQVLRRVEAPLRGIGQALGGACLLAGDEDAGFREGKVAVRCLPRPATISAAQSPRPVLSRRAQPLMLQAAAAAAFAVAPSPPAPRRR